MALLDLNALRRLLVGRLLIFCHHNADPDSVCSAYAFKMLARRLNESITADIALSGGASRLSKRIMKALSIEASSEAELKKADALVFLDTATLGQLEGWGEEIAELDAPKVFVDHHSPTEQVRKLSTILIVDEEATSTCEILYEFYRSFGIAPSSDVARALLIGIAYDSKHFTLGTSRMFRAVSELLESNVRIEDTLEPLTVPIERSERIARLRAAQRMRIRDVLGWTVAASHVGSFQASGARALIWLGADVSIVAGGEGGIIKASMRSTRKFYKETGVHLGRDMAMRLGEEFAGTGSGHSSSAGVNGRGKLASFLERAIEMIAENVVRANGEDGDNPYIGS